MDGDIFRLSPGSVIMMNDANVLYISLVVEHDHHNKMFNFKDYLVKGESGWQAETVSYGLSYLKIESDFFKILCTFPPDAKDMISKDIESFEEKYPEYFI